jgi:endo-1,4-beta-xylanase
MAVITLDYRFVVTACLRVALCVGFTIWGISDDHSWIPKGFSGYGDALLFDRHGEPRTADKAVIAALNAAPKFGYRE